MKIRLPSIAVLVLVALAKPALANVKVAAVIGDGMVLQQQARCHIWGSADPGERVSVRTSWGANADTTADSSGAWKVEIRTGKAAPLSGGLHPETISRGRDELDDELCDRPADRVRLPGGGRPLVEKKIPR